MPREPEDAQQDFAEGRPFYRLERGRVVVDGTPRLDVVFGAETTQNARRRERAQEVAKAEALEKLRRMRPPAPSRCCVCLDNDADAGMFCEPCLTGAPR